MSRVLSVLFSGVSITLYVGIVLSAILWFFGHLIGFGDATPFATTRGLLIALAVLWILCLITILIIVIRRGRKDGALAEDIAAPAQVAQLEDDASLADVEDMQSKLKTVLTRLRKSKAGKKHLYQLPWYVIIGPPGAGKTTAIANSGLTFPLDEQKPVAGVGGTRNCDWWFADDAVLVDTAGRYTTHESDEDADASAWHGFLSLLKKHRPRQPINGVIVAISLADLSMQDDQTQSSHAAAIKRRLSELREKLGIRFPVYVLFTKSDLVPGFDQSFEMLSREDRAQVWGFTLPVPGKDEDPGLDGAFGREFPLLVDRLNDQSLERMQSERDPARRSLIAGFPSQFATLQPVASRFLGELFQPDRVNAPHMVRGVYFTSGTQEGTPIDRLMTGMARTFGIGRQALGSGKGTGRSYFLTRLFRDVLFPESGLVSASDRSLRAFQLRRIATIAGAAVLAVALAAFWVRSYNGNTALVSRAQSDIAAFARDAAVIPQSPVRDGDLRLVDPVLTRLRLMESNPAAGPVSTPDGLGWGLYQGRVLGNSEVVTYREALNHYLLPRLLVRLEDQMQVNVNNPEVLHEALKVYLMLGSQGPMDPDMVTEWLQLDWQFSYPGPQNAPLRDSLAGHLDTMLGADMLPVPLSQNVVDYVRSVIARLPASQRIYNGILASAEAEAVPDFTLEGLEIPNIDRVFVRSSGASMSEGIEGIFTHQGFNEVFLNEALGIAEQIQSEAWVLGRAATTGQSDVELLEISANVLDLYYDDYVSRYDALLADLDVVSIQSPEQAVDVTNILSGAASPMAKVLQAVSRQTQLTRDFGSEAQSEVGEAAGQAGATALAGAQAVGEFTARRRLSPRAQLFFKAMASGTDASGQARREPGAFVEDRFAWLHAATTSVEGAPAPLDALLDTLRTHHQELSQQTFAGGSSPTTGSASLAAFQNAAKEIGGPLERWATQVAVGSSGVAADGARATVNARWNTVLPLCQALTANYPFNRRAPADVGLQDFATVFGPGGQIDGFFNEALKDIVNTQTNPWKFRRINDADLGMSEAALQQIQRAVDIRNAFFATGPTPSVAFQLTPEALHEPSDSITLEVHGATVAFDHGVATPVAVAWPGSVGLARATILPPGTGADNVISRDGPWAWFRLLDAAEIRGTNASDRKRVIFNFSGRIAIFQMQSSAVLNAFDLPALDKFNCPASF